MIDTLWLIMTEIIGLRWLLFNSLISILVYQYVFKNWSFFRRNNIKFVRGLPLLGAQWRVFTARESINESVIRLYNGFSKEKIIGIFDFGGKPVYIIRDPELIKQIAIKDFDHFMNHTSFFGDSDQEPLLGRTLFIMRDQRWKNMRSNLSPAFTGRKMRLMFSLIGDVSNTFCSHLRDEITVNGGSLDCNIRDKFGRFTTDAIASCAFGVNVDSMKDQDNEFYKFGGSLTNFSGFRSLMKFIAIFTVPKLLKYLNITMMNKRDTDYFREIVNSNMAYREKNGIIRNDMINILLEMKKGNLINDSKHDKEIDGDIGFATVQESSMAKVSNQVQHNWDEDDFIAQSMIFFLAGFNNIALTFSFIAHDLAVNQDIQAKLYEEIRETNDELNGKPLSYETLQKMKYLDMVVSESMRMWTQLPTNDRVVNKTYELEIDNDHKVIFNPGETIMFPTHGLHRDAKYFPNPNTFDPDRFSDENKDKIVSGTYLPFGIGPRNCIASRFALMETKACIYHLLSHCRVEMSPKTQHPIQLKVSVSVEAKNGFWLILKLRE